MIAGICSLVGFSKITETTKATIASTPTKIKSKTAGNIIRLVFLIVIVAILLISKGLFSCLSTKKSGTDNLKPSKKIPKISETSGISLVIDAFGKATWIKVGNEKIRRMK